MNALVLLRSVHRSPGADETLPGLGPCDRAALHTALELAGDDEVTAVTAGPSADEECLRCALALGASRAVRLWDAFLDSDDLHALAAVLAAGVQRLPFDVVLAGHRSADWASGATGPAIAHILGVPHVTAVVAARRRDGVLEVDQLRDEGILALDVEPPALLSISAGPALAPRRARHPLADPDASRVDVWDMQDMTLKMLRRAAKPATAVELSVARCPALASSASALLLQLKNAGLLR